MNNKTISGKYQLNRELGRGGMGIVYEAHDTSPMDRTVAIKALHAQFTGDSDFLERFKGEARKMALLDHSNIIRAIEWLEDSGSYYIVMDYFPGKNLKQILSEPNALTQKESVDIVLQVAKALSHAHEHGSMIHRDIKPENIMVNDAGTAKITDFGIATVTDESSLTVVGQVIGTPAYMSPEQARGEKVDFRSDLYSLGMVLYEMLTGQVVYQGIPSNSIPEKLKSVKELRLSFPSDIPSSLQDLVRSLLRKKKEKRLPDAARLVIRLEEEKEKAEKIRLAKEVLSKDEMTSDKTRPINSPEPGSKLRKKLLFAILAVLFFVGVGTYLNLRSEEALTKKRFIEQEAAAVLKAEKAAAVLKAEKAAAVLKAEKAADDLKAEKAADDLKAKKAADDLKAEEPEPEPEPEPVPELEGDLNTVLKRLKTAYEKKDLKSLQKMSEMTSEKSSFLKHVFKNYQNVQVSISGVSFKGDNTALATVTITNLTDQTGKAIKPSFLTNPADQREVTHLTLRKQNGRWGKIIW